MTNAAPPDQTLILILDLAGTFIFAISGAMAARANRLDLFGVLVLAFSAGNAGGITRDVLIGAVPPPKIEDWRYVGASIAAGLLAFWFSPIIKRLRSPVLIPDAAGLGLFAVSGATKALAFGLGPIPAILLGGLTGIGGGMLRDRIVGAALCIGLRVEAIRRGWRLPRTPRSALSRMRPPTDRSKTP